MTHLFFEGWEGIWHVIICAALSYLTLFLFIKISGKRTLAKLNAFDFVVTVTLGSTLSSMILAKVALAEGAIALAVIIGMQFLFAWMAKESKTMEKVINAEPTLLYYNGEFVKAGMDKELITKDEVYAEVRKFRIEQMDEVMAVVMELNGDITVVKKSGRTGGETSLDKITEGK